MSTPALDPRLFDADSDTAEDLAYKSILNGVITLEASPSQAARQIDEWVTTETELKQKQIQGRELTEEEKDGLYLVAPNSSRLIDMILGSIARISSTYAPGHGVQNALVALIQALSDIPKHQVLDLVYGDEHQPILNKTRTLWPFKTASTDFLANPFRREADDLAYPFSEVETLGSETQIRWRNLQSFIARLTRLELIDCSAISALLYIVPSAITYPNLTERKVGGPSRIAADLTAASQWLVDDESCLWVKGKCEKDDHEVWNMRNWNSWKAQMEFIAGDERFSDEARALAGMLKAKMK